MRRSLALLDRDLLLPSRGSLASAWTFSYRTHRTIHSKRSNSYTSSSFTSIGPHSIQDRGQSLSNPSNSKYGNGTSKHPSNLPPMSILSTSSLVRSLMLGYCFTSPRLMRFLISVMNRIIHSKSRLLDLDSNPLLRRMVRMAVYDHFCAGVNPTEVKKTVQSIKKCGYSGVILGYNKEIVIEEGADLSTTDGSSGLESDKTIEIWFDLYQKTLNLIGENDYLAVKFTGAGINVSQALIEGRDPPEQLVKALDTLCNQARSQGSRLWIDAEQQIFQPTIDRWTIDLMRRHNRDGQAIVSNTIQSYLKATRASVREHLRLAQAENWTLGIKLVRGAYIASDTRDRIWGTKAETDESYDSTARDIITKNFDEFSEGKGNFPKVDLFVAGHNKVSIQKVSTLVKGLISRGENVRPVAYGQLQGMADETSCALIKTRQDAIALLHSKNLNEKEVELQRQIVDGAPRPYKCLAWGTVKDCVHFLVRRAVENASAADRLKDGLAEMKTELWRRLTTVGTRK